jgi:hypothetical protein
VDKLSNRVVTHAALTRAAYDIPTVNECIIVNALIASGLNECIALNASTEERAMMSSWRVTLLALGFSRSNRPAGDVDQAIIEG